MEQLKTCSKCHRKLVVSWFYKEEKKCDGRHSECKECSIHRSRKWNVTHREQTKVYSATYANNHKEALRVRAALCYNLNPEKFRAKSRNWTEANPEKHNEIARQSNARLPDAYVRGCLLQGTTLKGSDIPAELIEAKRRQLQVYRLIKEKRNA